MSREQMIPIILNKNYERIAEIDDYLSFIWTTRYYSAGDFELCTDISKASILQIGNLVMRKGDDHAGIIEKIQITRSDEKQEMIIATGRSLHQILARRVITTQTILSGLVTQGIKLLVDENIVNPVNPSRKISNFVIDMSSGSTASTAETDVQYTGENLLDVVSSLCETYSIGMDMILNDDNEFVFKLYDGIDRSYGQSANPYVVFSDTYDNLLNSEYDEDYSTFATDVLVGGEGNGVNRTMVWSAKDSKSGLERYEKFLDASNAVSNDNIITQATYEKQLEGLGLEAITEYTTAFSGEVDFTGVELGVDINIGDICTIENSTWGMYINSRLIEVIESIGEDGSYAAIPTFGT